MLYKTCPYCGANNDPGEVCDCREAKRGDKGDGFSGMVQPEQITLFMPAPEEPKKNRHHNVAI